jgi:hypothetical protein
MKYARISSLTAPNYKIYSVQSSMAAVTNRCQSAETSAQDEKIHHL